ncbi:MAG: hypothetical protein G8345_03050 [Magnetococcales bacterium]|nr:hypothetical protein [Magnetococcales bacterium]
MFAEKPEIVLHDALGELLGAGDGCFRYTFDDVVKLSGHACPTAAGAFLLVVRALPLIYGDEMPQRGDIEVIVHGDEEEGVNGPISQILTLLTGAAAENGFRGLAGRYGRKGLLRFVPQTHGRQVSFTFKSISRNRSVTMAYSPESIPPDPDMSQWMHLALGNTPDAQARHRFAQAWRGRVERILADEGRSTVREVSAP